MVKNKNKIPVQARKKKTQKINGWGFRSVLKYIPAFVMFGMAVFINITPSIAASSQNTVLGYATSTSISGLLSGTNSQRSANSVGALSLHSALNSAAQSKANDMVARNYWSHNTPDGQEPWVFFTAAGYSYKAAGENLAYGFATSSDTITGWMNSPAHRDNLLSTAFLEVGFGIANSANFVGNGEQTIVVAMYGTQKNAVAAAPVAPAATPTPAAPAPTPTPAATPAPKPATPAPVAAEAEPIATTPALEAVQPTPADTTVPAAAQKESVETTAAPVKVRRIQLLTGGNAAWSATVLTLTIGSIGFLWLMHHGLRLKRLLLSGEHFMLHRMHFELTILAVLTLGYTLLGGSGVIR